ncbi:MAG: serine/threonine protein kinase [Myxococcales bacterium]|nr:serine/threonine protein kinase [Myxococcales bacterium]
MSSERPPSGSDSTMAIRPADELGRSTPPVVRAADDRDGAAVDAASGDTQRLSVSVAAHAATRRSLDSGPPGDPDELPEQPERIGRYLVLERLGAGGMGVVFAAFDPELERKIAIKLIRGRRDREALDRLRREAMAMARLSHPNVVACFDVGRFMGQIWVAMEFVRGETLGHWLRRAPRTWREVLAVFIPAGRGLAAAHDAELVHRDFKPDNVLVDVEGRPRVTDFGLARTARSTEVEATSAGAVEHRELEVSGLDAPLTQHGALLGTPAYMAREQHLGLVADARTDQFSFCASLYQALYGQLPFAGKTVLELADNVLHGRVREPPRGRKVPAFVHRAVLRGLSAEPAQRWPSMHDLLRTLGRDPARTRRRALVGGLLLALGAGGAAAVLAGPGPCDGAAALAGAWDPARRAAVAAALRATGVAYADETLSRVQGSLDGYAAAWSDMHVQACTSHRRGALSSELLDLEMACLDARRGELVALVEVLAGADVGVAERAVQAAAGLPPLGGCADARALRTGVDPPPVDQAAAVAEVRARIARAAAEAAGGRYGAAAELAGAAVAAAHDIGYRPLVGQAQLRRAVLARNAGAPAADSEAELVAAWRAGLATRDDELAAEAAVEQIATVGRDQARLADGERWAADARALLDRRGRVDVLAARFDLNLGNMYVRAGRLAQAIASLERAVELRESVLGAAHPDVAAARTALGEALRRQGRHAEAAATHEQALRDTVAAFGPDHPQVAVARNNLGVAYGWLGRRRDAVAEFEAAIAIRERALGPDHPQVASSRSNLASELIELGRLDRAEAELRRAIDTLERRVGRHPDLSNAQNNLGNLYFAQRRHADALAAYSAALATDAALLGEDSLDASITRNNVGTALWQLGRHDDAERELRRALAGLEAGLGRDSPQVAFPLLGLGAVLLDQGRVAEAVVALTRASELADEQDSAPLRAFARAELARARLAADPRPTRAARADARRDVEAALADLRAGGPLFGYASDRAEAFLRGLDDATARQP